MRTKTYAFIVAGALVLLGSLIACTYVVRDTSGKIIGCKKSTGEPVTCQCYADSECPSNRPYCAGTSCQECRGDGDCDSDDYEQRPFCRNGYCKECRHGYDGDCDYREVCNNNDHCEKVECTDTNQCDNDERCSDSHHCVKRNHS